MPVNGGIASLRSQLRDRLLDGDNPTLVKGINIYTVLRCFAELGGMTYATKIGHQAVFQARLLIWSFVNSS